MGRLAEGNVFIKHRAIILFSRTYVFCAMINAGWVSLSSQTYKRTPIHFYDPHKAPFLDHYRLASLFASWSDSSQGSFQS